MGLTFQTVIVVFFEGFVVFDAEFEMNGRLLLGPTVDHDILVEPRTGFEIAKGSRIPCVLDLSTGEEWGKNGFVGHVNHNCKE